MSSNNPIADPNSPNLYTYCANSPLLFTDPSGLEVKTTQNPDGTTTDTWYDRDGKKTSEQTYDKNGNLISDKEYGKDGKTLKKQTDYVYDGTDKRAETRTEYTRNGVLVTVNKQGQDGYGQWETWESEIKGYNSRRDFKNGNWNFTIDKYGTITIGKGVDPETGVVNGDLLLRGMLTYVRENRTPFVQWGRNMLFDQWDIGVNWTTQTYSYSLRGKIYTGNQFNNIAIGYVGGHYLLGMPIIRAGGLWYHWVTYKDKKWNDEGQDQRFMSYGLTLFYEDYWGV